MFKNLIAALVVAFLAVPAFAAEKKEESSCDDVLAAAKGELAKKGMKELGAKELGGAVAFGWTDGEMTVVVLFAAQPLENPGPFKQVGLCKRPDGKAAVVYIGMAKNPQA